MCPYWADFDFRSGQGVAWQRVQSPGSAQTNARFSALTGKNFVSLVDIVVTWDAVGYYSYHTDLLNTAQIEVHSDGTNTYACFNFPSEGINWTTGDASYGTGGFGGIPAQVGFDAGDNA
jgi:hypothetical protein